MTFNIPGILAIFQVAFQPRLVLPSLIVNEDIRQLDFSALRSAGYRAAVFDKDNCLTVPHHDKLVPQLEDAWQECKQVFGEDNVLVVSNTAGSSNDASELKANSVSLHLQARVLRHNAHKPSYSCINDIRAYFNSLPRPVSDEELIIIGDRVFTDIVMANRMKFRKPPRPQNSQGEEKSQNKQCFHPCGPLSILTTGLWKRENIFLRKIELATVRGTERWFTDPQENARRKESMQQFVRPPKQPTESNKNDSLTAWWNRI